MIALLVFVVVLICQHQNHCYDLIEFMKQLQKLRRNELNGKKSDILFASAEKLCYDSRFQKYVFNEAPQSPLKREKHEITFVSIF